MLLPNHLLTLFMATMLYVMPIAEPLEPQTFGGNCDTVCALNCAGSSGNNVMYRMCYNSCMDICENPSY